MSKMHIVIIGAGPGGYTAAFHAADLGLSVTLIDQDPVLGGVCLNRGCIPSKALLHAAHAVRSAKEAETMGITLGHPSIDIDRLRAWKAGITSRLTGGLARLAAARQVHVIQGKARFLNSSTLEIKKSDGTTTPLSFDKAIIATGSRPVTLPFLPISDRVWDSTRALELPCIPGTLLVIGGRYIGLELGTAYAGLGSAVTIVEALPQLLAGADRDLAEVVLQRLKKTLSAVLAETNVIAAKELAKGIEITFEDKKGIATTRVFDQVLTAVGRRPDTDTLGLENTAVRLTDRKFIIVNAQRQTADPSIYAIGDVTGDPMLAHKASREARIAAAHIAGELVSYAPKAIPSVVFTDPELAWAGLTETEANEQGLNIAVFKFPWLASGRALTLDRTEGITKIIADKTTRKILGIGIAGH